MKTKFVLFGGFNPENQEEDNSDFYKEILKNTSQKTNVLIVPFAKEIERVAETTKRVVGEFNDNKGQTELNFEVANEESFLEQLKSADVVYFQGGKTLKILEVLKKFPTLKDLLETKVVAGESAGANVLSKFFFSPSANGVFEGLGILPIKIIPHYKEEYKDVFKDVGADLEDVFLKEYEMKVFQ